MKVSAHTLHCTYPYLRIEQHETIFLLKTPVVVQLSVLANVHKVRVVYTAAAQEELSTHLKAFVRTHKLQRKTEGEGKRRRRGMSRGEEKDEEEDEQEAKEKEEKKINRYIINM